jgi:hypothetical protein
MFIVECYDPSTPNLKFVREVPLYKNNDFVPFVKSENSIDYLKDASFAINGSTLMM